MIRYLKWLAVSAGFMALFLALFVGWNLMVDTYGVRMTFLPAAHPTEAKIIQCNIELNQHLFKPAYVLRHPGRFDAFLFGSSRVGVIDVGKIPGASFYNMNFSQGLPQEHLDVLKVFLKRGIRVRTVVVGLDEVSFMIRAREHRGQLLRIPHPAVSGDSELSVLLDYYFRVPQAFEITDGVRRMLRKEQRNLFALDDRGMILGWRRAEQLIAANPAGHAAHPAFRYQPARTPYRPEAVEEAFRTIEEMIRLSRERNFQLIFFINPLHRSVYLNHAENLFPIKKRLAGLTPFYDFSGLNTITQDNGMYYEADHYRYAVGDLILERIFAPGGVKVPDDFGALVTRETVSQWIAKERRELPRAP